MSDFIEVQSVYHDANGEKPSSKLFLNLDNVMYLRSVSREVWFTDGTTRELDYDSWHKLLKTVAPTTEPNTPNKTDDKL